MGCCASSPTDSPVASPDETSRTPADAQAAAQPTRNPRLGGFGSPIPGRGQAQTTGSSQFNRPLKRTTCGATKKQWTREELERERTAWFDTRVTGQQEVWSALKVACESLRDHDLDLAQGLIDAVGATVPTGDLSEGAYDEVGNFYKIPPHIAANPPNLIESTTEPEAGKSEGPSDAERDEADFRREEKGKGVLHDEELITVKARLSDRGGPDVIVTIGREQSIRMLSNRVHEAGSLDVDTKVKIAYMGKVLKEGETLQDQGWKAGHVVNALVFPK